MHTRPPLWMMLLIAIFLLPVLLFPTFLANIPADDSARSLKTFVWIYPFYMALSAWLAWNAYNNRPYISWILLTLMALSSSAIWIMTAGL